jgi:hypothetical protein
LNPQTNSSTRNINSEQSRLEVILEAEYRIDTAYLVWKAQIDEIPYGAPYVQANVTQTVGAIPVTGSVTAGSRTTADNWAKDRRQFAQGYLDIYQMRCSNVYPPLNGSTPVRYRTEFTFSARTVSLTVQS